MQLSAQLLEVAHLHSSIVVLQLLRNRLSKCRLQAFTHDARISPRVTRTSSRFAVRMAEIADGADGNEEGVGTALVGMPGLVLPQSDPSIA